jgi:hypothetical protein
VSNSLRPMSDPREIICASLSCVRVRPSGQAVELGFREGSGADSTLVLPHQVLGMLLMTLPGLIETALRLRTGDTSLRHVYPVGDWQLESASDGESLLLRLATPDGFAVSFCLAAGDARTLGGVLAGHTMGARRSATDPTLTKPSFRAFAQPPNCVRGARPTPSQFPMSQVLVPSRPRPVLWPSLNLLEAAPSRRAARRVWLRTEDLEPSTAQSPEHQA